MASARPLAGRVAWVTGGASGMGRATALRLARAGASVAVGSLVESQRDKVLPDQNVHTPPDADLEETLGLIKAEGVTGYAGPLDVSLPQSVAEAHAEITALLGPIDILVNAAGTSARKLLLEHPDEIWTRLMDTNVTGAYSTIRLCFPGMVERRFGRIVNFASTAANVGYVRHAAYCASKSALLGLTRCVGIEGAPHNVTCNAINPGWVATGSNHSACEQEIAIAGLDITVEEYRRRVAQDIPQKRFLSPDEVGALAAFLCSDAAPSINAEVLTISMGSQW
jgi:NAD(P)-dependent dehydrogenase (short-subunit alcohol dehydrogenase family)